MEKTPSRIFFLCKGRLNGDVSVARGIEFQEARPGAGFQTGHFVQEKAGGATVVRLK